MRHDLLHLLRPTLHEIAPRRPQDDAHALVGRVAHQCREVDGDGGVEQVFGIAPSLVDDDVFKTVGRREVYVVSIGFGVHPGREVHPREIPVVPPVPSHFARLDPRRVLQPALGAELCGDVAGEQVGVVCADDHHPPREKLPAGHPRDVVGALGGHEVQARLFVHGLFERIGSKLGYERVPLAFFQKHAGIVQLVGFHDDGPFAFGQCRCEWRDGQRVGEHLGKPLLVVVGFKRVAVAFARPVVVHVGYEGLVVGCEAEFRPLVHYVHLLRCDVHEAVAGRPVVGTKLHVVVARAPECHAAAVLVLPRLGANHFHAGAVVLAVAHRHADGRWQQHLHAAVVHGPCEVLTVVDGDDRLPVGRSEGVGFSPCPERCEGKGQNGQCPDFHIFCCLVVDMRLVQRYK